MTEDKKTGFMTLDWFRPLYRRVILVVVIAGWCAWEWLPPSDQFWGLLTTAMLAYAVWTFFIKFDRELAKQDDNAKPEN